MGLRTGWIPFRHERPDSQRSPVMLHVRLIAPPESTSEILQLLDASPAVTHLCVNEQSARKPSGDVVSFDVAREGATSVPEALRGFGLEQQGAIVVENLDISMSASAIKAEKKRPANLRTRWSGKVWNRAQVRKRACPSLTSA